MRPRVVCDASAVVAALLDAGPDGQWADEHLRGAALAAPAAMPFQAAEVIRRHERTGLVPADQAAQAHADLLDLPVELWPHEVLAARCWALRGDLPAIDAASLALAELTGSTLVTLDRRLARVPGVRCAVVAP